MPSVRSGPKFREMLGHPPLTSDYWACGGVMNIINGIARGVSPYVRDPPSLAAEERMLWERSTHESGVR